MHTSTLLLNYSFTADIIPYTHYNGDTLLTMEQSSSPTSKIKLYYIKGEIIMTEFLTLYVISGKDKDDKTYIEIPKHKARQVDSMIHKDDRETSCCKYMLESKYEFYTSVLPLVRSNVLEIKKGKYSIDDLLMVEYTPDGRIISIILKKKKFALR